MDDVKPISRDHFAIYRDDKRELINEVINGINTKLKTQFIEGKQTSYVLSSIAQDKQELIAQMFEAEGWTVQRDVGILYFS